MDNSVEMKIDWVKIQEYVDFVTVNDDGDVGCYYHNDHILMFITNTRVHMVSVFKSIDEVRMFCKKVIERPIAYPNPLMKYIGCEVSVNGRCGWIVDVKDFWFLIDYDDRYSSWCGSEYEGLFLVNEDGSLVQFGEEDWQ